MDVYGNEQLQVSSYMFTKKEKEVHHNRKDRNFNFTHVTLSLRISKMIM